VRAQYIKL